MNRAPGFCLAIFGLLAAIPALAATEAAPSPSVLEGIPALEKRITYAETKIPLGELIAKVAADTGVPLRADPAVADEPVAIAVTAFPARELLEQLAGLLDYQWRVQAFRRSGIQAFRGDKNGPASDVAGPERLNARTPERLNVNARTPERPSTIQPGDHPPGWEQVGMPGDPDMAAEIRRKEKEMQERWVGADGYQVTVRFNPDFPSPGSLTFNAITSPLRGGQRVGPFYENPVFVIAINPVIDLQPLLGEDPARKALLAEDPLLGAKRQFPPPARPPVPHTYRSLQDLLPDLARTYGVNFIADSYWTAPGIDDRELTSQPVALYDLLDRFTYLNHWLGRGYWWDRHGSPIWLRSRYWFLDRPSEIPLRYVRRWLEQCDRQGSLTLAEDAAMASALTDPQLRSISELLKSGAFPPQLEDLAALYPARHLLRLDAALLPDQRQELEHRGSLSIASLPARLRPLVRATLDEIARMQYPLMDLDQWTSGRLSLTAEPQIRVREERGGIVSYRLEPVPAPGQPPAKLRPIAAAPAPRRSIRRYPVMKLQLQLFYGAQEPASVELIVAPSPGS